MKSLKTSAAVLLSGGMDSVMALFYAKNKFDEVYAISYEYEQGFQNEFVSAQKIANLLNVMWVPQELKLPEINPISNSENNQRHVTGLYLMMLMLGAQWCSFEQPKILNLVYGGSKSEFPDMKHRAISHQTDTIQAAFDNTNCNIWVPNLYSTKAELIKTALETDFAMDAIALSQSCTVGIWPPCEKCVKCISRAAAFTTVGVKDPIARRGKVWEKMIKS